MGLIHTESWQRFPINKPMVASNAGGAALAVSSNYFLTEK